MKKIVTTATGVWRLANTPSGNPRYRVQFPTGFSVTAPDAQIAHRITEVIGVPHEFTFNADDEIIDAVLAPPEPAALTVGRLREALRGVPGWWVVRYRDEGRSQTYTAAEVAESAYDRSLIIF